MSSFLPPSILNKATKVAFPHKMTIKQFETVNRGDMTSSSNRSAKIEFDGIDYLNTAEGVLMYDLHSTSAYYINVDNSAYSPWQEISIISNTGETIDHIDNFNLLMNKLIEYRTSPGWTSSSATRFGCSLAPMKPTVVRSTDIGWRDTTAIGVNGASGAGYKTLSIPIPIGLFSLPFIPFWKINGKITLQLKLADRQSGVIASNNDATWKVNNVRYVAQCIDILDESTKAQITAEMSTPERSNDVDGVELSGAVCYEHFNAPVNSYIVNYKIMPSGISSMKALFCWFRDNTDISDITSRSVSKTVGSRVQYNATTYEVFNQFYLKNNGEYIPPHKISTLEDAMNHTIQAIGESVVDGSNMTHITAKNYMYDPASSGLTEGLISTYTADTAVLVANTAGVTDAYVAPIVYLSMASNATNAFTLNATRETADMRYIPIYAVDSSYSGYKFYTERDHPHVLSTFGIGIDLEAFQDSAQDHSIWSGTTPHNFEIYCDLSKNSASGPWTDGDGTTHTLQCNLYIMYDATYIITPGGLVLKKS